MTPRVTSLPASPLTLIRHHPGAAAGIHLYVKRDDLLHPQIPGNKWRKLEPVLSELAQGRYGGILTFGGPFSNHLHAVAAAGRAYGFPTAAVVRGRSADPHNPTLAFARACGTALHPVAKRDYDAGPDSPAVREIIAAYPDYLVLPEGGSGAAAARNCMKISEEVLAQLERPERLFIAVPAGTGCTAAGVIAGLGEAGTAVVFPAAPYGVEETSIRSLLTDLAPGPHPDFRIVPEYGRYGFAAYRPEWIDFALDFYLLTGILPDPIYTVKMLYGLFEMLPTGYFPEGSTVVAVHTGGLQGWEGFRARFGRGGH